MRYRWLALRRWQIVPALFAVILTCAAAAAPVRAQAPAPSVPASSSFDQGAWNLLAFPAGTNVAGTHGPLYTLQPGDTSYEVVDPGQGTVSGYGYWTFFGRGTPSFPLAPGSDAPYSIAAPAGQWVMIGDPSGTLAASVGGADLVLRYAGRSGYVSTTTLGPGDGAWAYTAQGNTITVTPGGPGTMIITAVQPDAAPAGAQVTISGYGFGPPFPGVGNGVDSRSSVCFFGSMIRFACEPAPVISWSDTQIVVQIPLDDTIPGPAAVGVHNLHVSLSSSNGARFTITAPSP